MQCSHKHGLLINFDKSINKLMFFPTLFSAVEVIQFSIVRGLRNMPVSQRVQLPHHCKSSYSYCTIWRPQQYNTQTTLKRKSMVKSVPQIGN